MKTQNKTSLIYYCTFPIFKDSEFELPDNFEYLVNKTKEISDERGYSYTREEIESVLMSFVEQGIITRLNGKMLFKYRN